MPTSYFSSQESSLSAKNRARLSNILTTSKERTHEYKKWSENATIIKYRSETQTYDILVSLLNATNSSRKNNRTMRGVKSIIPTESHIFKAGDQVLIGYISDRRESPIILGFRKSPDQSLAGTSAGGEGSSTEPPCDLRCFSVSNLGEIQSIGENTQFECSDNGSGGTGEMRFRVECAVGNVRWKWTGDTACSTADCFAASINLLKNGREFIIKKLACTHSFTSTQAAYCIVRCFRFTDDAAGGSCSVGCNIVYYNCDGNAIAGSTITSSASATGTTCADSAADSLVCENFAENTFEVDHPEAEVSSIYALVPGCQSAPVFPAVEGSDLSDVCGWFSVEYNGQNILLETDAETLASMRANGCCPCSMIDETVVTATDSLGRSCSINLKFKDASVALESTYADGTCGS